MLNAAFVVAWPDPPRIKWDRGPIPADLAAVTAGRLAAYLAAPGFAPGFLHPGKRGRWSLAWDAIEPLRPAIEARAFRFIAHERFVASDFVRALDGSLRLAPGLLSAILNERSASPATLAQCVRWLARLILTADKGGAGEPKHRLRDVESNRLTIGGGALKSDKPSLMFIGLGRESR